jgi:cytochrome c553
VRLDRLTLGAIAAAAAIGASGIASAQQAAPQGDAKRAESKVSMCAGCHGIPGYRNAFPEVYHVPLIAGQNPGYIVAALKAYAAGERNHGTMKAIAAGLTEQDMADIAAFYGAQKGK